MVKFFSNKMNKRNSKKGFTLIELIVVIAILGILAAIAIPRFAGFTDKAKQRADDQYIALYTNAITVLLAEGKLEIGAANNTVSIPVTAGAPTLGAGIDGVDAADFTDLIKATDLKYYTAAAVITITDDDGSVTIDCTPNHPSE